MATTQKTQPSKGNKPAHEIRLGRIKGTIWANSGENGTRYNVTFTRLYKDGDTWKDSQSFGRDDLPLIAKVADQAHSWIFSHGAAGASANGHAEENGEF
ncbi:MAG: hypothetical protein K1X67_05645 [Fimbriimonadaceae bacterium]|nr:hypothetical protein [Fimbriimonadaceae bacterium]